MSEPKANYAGLGLLAGLTAVAGGLLIYISHTQTPRVKVKELWTYPIKSCAGFQMTEGQLDAFGFAYDRKWVIVDPETMKFRHQRVLPVMATIRTAIRDGDLVLTVDGMPDLVVKQKAEGEKEEVVDVDVWGDNLVGVREGDEADAWLSDALGVPAMLCRRPAHGYHRDLGKNAKESLGEKNLNQVPGQFAYCDEHPLLVCSTASLADLNARLRVAGKKEVPMTRFRCNVVIGEEGGLFSSSLTMEPFFEQKWKTVTVGGTTLHSTGQKIRCKMTTIDQETGFMHRMKRESGEDNVDYFEPIRTLRTYRLDAKHNGVIFGESFSHATHEIGSVIRVGDVVECITVKPPPVVKPAADKSD